MTERLRITFVLPTLDLSGGVRVIATLADELHTRGHDVLVVAGPPTRPPLRDRLRAKLKGDAHRWWPRPGEHHFANRPVKVKQLDTARPITDADLPEADFVVATWWETAEWVAALDDSRGSKAYYVQHHEVNMTGQPPERVNATFDLPLNAFACSAWVRDQVEHATGHSLPIVPYGVDRALFDAPERDKNPAPTAGFMYSDVPFKGTDTTLAALELVAKDVPDLRITTFGSRAPTAELPLPANATFELAPAQARIAEIYAACDCWIVGSRAEGFGLPMLEAMACRTPLVSTRTGGAEDLITRGINGHIAEVEDPRDLAARIRGVLTLDANAWRMMSDAAHATAEAHTWSASADRFLEQLHAAHANAGGHA